MKKYFFILVLLVNTLNSYTQDYNKLIIGDWILKDIAEPGWKHSEIYTIRISFLENFICYRSLNLLEKSAKLTYFIDNDKLIIDNSIFKIDSLSNEMLILKDVLNPEYYSVYVHQKKPFINKDSIAVYYYDTISIAFDEEFIPLGLITVRHSYDCDSLQLIKYPEFINNMNLNSYLLQEIVYSSKFFKVFNPRKLEVSFTVLENGKMSEITVVDENKDKWLEEKIYKVFKGLETKWAPLYIENRIYKYKIYFNLIIIYRPKSDTTSVNQYQF